MAAKQIVQTSISGNTPVAESLEYNQLAINSADGEIHIRKKDDTNGDSIVTFKNQPDGVYSKFEIDNMLSSVGANRVSNTKISEATVTLDAGETQDIATHADVVGHNVLSIKEFVENPGTTVESKWDFDSTDSSKWEYNEDTVEFIDGKIRLKGEYSGKEVVDIKSYNGASYALLNDGTLMVCGYNAYNELGINGSTVNQLNWVPSDITDVVQILSLSERSVFVKTSDGKVYYSGYWKFLIGGQHTNQNSTDGVYYLSEYDEQLNLVRMKHGDSDINTYYDYSYRYDYNYYGTYVWKEIVFDRTTSDPNSWKYWSGDEEIVKMKVKSGDIQHISGYALTNKGNLWFCGIRRQGPFTEGPYGDDGVIPYWFKVNTDVKNIDRTRYGTVIIKNDNTVWITGYTQTSSPSYGASSNFWCETGWCDEKYGNGHVYSNNHGLRGWYKLRIENAIDVACGDGHTVVLRNDGTIMTVGYNHYGQCGRPAGVPSPISADSTYSYGNSSSGYREHWPDFYVPTYPECQDVVDIECYSNSTVITRSNGDRYIMGYQLHSNVDSYTSVPTKIDIPKELLFMNNNRNNMNITFIKKPTTNNIDGDVQAHGYNTNGGMGTGVDNDNTKQTLKDTKNRNIFVGSISFTPNENVVVKSTSSIDISESVEFGGISISDYVPEGTSIKYALSVDNGQNWFDVNGTITDVTKQGSTSNEMLGMIISNDMILNNDTLDILAIMSTTDSFISPTIDQIDVSLLIEGAWKVIGFNDGLEILDDGIDSYKVTNLKNTSRTLKIAVETKQSFSSSGTSNVGEIGSTGEFIEGVETY